MIRYSILSTLDIYSMSKYVLLEGSVAYFPRWKKKKIYSKHV